MAIMRETRNAYTTFGGNPFRKWPLGKHRFIYDGNIKDLHDTGREGGTGIESCQVARFSISDVEVQLLESSLLIVRRAVSGEAADGFRTPLLTYLGVHELFLDIT
jgi:hypothetical protein